MLIVLNFLCHSCTWDTSSLCVPALHTCDKTFHKFVQNLLSIHLCLPCATSSCHHHHSHSWTHDFKLIVLHCLDICSGTLKTCCSNHQCICHFFFCSILSQNMPKTCPCSFSMTDLALTHQCALLWLH